MTQTNSEQTQRGVRVGPWVDLTQCPTCALAAECSALCDAGSVHDDTSLLPNTSLQQLDGSSSYSDCHQQPQLQPTVDNENKKSGAYDGRQPDQSRNTAIGHPRFLRKANVVLVLLILLLCVAMTSLWQNMLHDKSPVKACHIAFVSKAPQHLPDSSPPTSLPIGNIEEIDEWPLVRNPKRNKRKKLPRPQLPNAAKRIPRPLTLHNETLIDNYYWMHQIEMDPDVRAYIDLEANYVKSWIHYSGIENLQTQLEQEITQIKNAMTAKTFIDDFENDDGDGDGDGDEDEETEIRSPKTSESTMKNTKSRLEGTQFWDVDHWRYWLDLSEGDYGVYRRRPVPENGYHRTVQQKRTQYMNSQQFVYHETTWGDSHTQPSSHDVEGIGGCSGGSQIAQTPFSGDTVTSAGVETVLDVNKIAKQSKMNGDSNGDFIFGSIEVQPRYTFLRRSIPSEYGDVERPREPERTFVAYTFDTSGDERYKINITTVANEPGHLTVADVDSEYSAANKCSVAGLSGSLGSVLDNAGPETRWLKIGRSLYLYFTRLDSKGLRREVWRVLVESFDHLSDRTEREFICVDDEPKPELVMREEDERNELTLAETNDRRFFLIESNGQTNSRTYFWNIGDPKKGWNLVREGQDNVIYKVEHHSGSFFLRTNHGDAANFKVLRIPVAYWDNSSGIETPYIAKRQEQPTAVKDGSRFLVGMEDTIVIEHDPHEFLERFESFVEHFVAWVWRVGMQEIRIYHVPHPGRDDAGKWPLSELERLRPYDKDSKIATVMPSNIRDRKGRLMRDFYSTRLRYSNCSFVHPWALYEYDMHSLTPTTRALHTQENLDDREDRIRKATRLVCRDAFPLGVRYGRKNRRKSMNDDENSSRSGLEGSINHLVKDPWKEQDKEIAKFKELRLMVPSTHSTMNGSTDNPDEQVPVLIPVSMVYYNNPDQNFPRPAFVKAYGAYGAMTSAEFEPEVILPLLHRGLLIVQIHPRGDGVLGPQWYKDGKATNKMNTFYDVEDVLRYLRDSGMVKPEGVVMEGRSAGGLVSGWIANRWGEALIPKETIGDEHGPDQSNIVREMVGAVLTQMPFVDVITGMANKDIPWVEYEWAEWGNPLESQEVFETMKAYSPYDRIRNQPYPPMMVLGGLADSRVSYAEPLKFVTKLRSVDGKTNDCQPLEKSRTEDRESNSGSEPEGDVKGAFGNGAEGEWNKKKKELKMCGGRKDTALLLQMEEGGHFSGKKSLWMAFALFHLGANKATEK
ncbi:hypothetical protein BG004_005055 [Podila humilis]|nr:hypothetical protein BG004_005055 [Podila humilis]